MWQLYTLFLRYSYSCISSYVTPIPHHVSPLYLIICHPYISLASAPITLFIPLMPFLYSYALRYHILPIPLCYPSLPLPTPLPIPLSIGIGDIIEIAVEHQCKLYDNIRVVSNYMRFDDKVRKRGRVGVGGGLLSLSKEYGDRVTAPHWIPITGNSRLDSSGSQPICHQSSLVACNLPCCTLLHAASICIFPLLHAIPIFLFLQIRIIYHRLLIISDKYPPIEYF